MANRDEQSDALGPKLTRAEYRLVRNENRSEPFSVIELVSWAMFFLMLAVLLLVGAGTLSHEPAQQVPVTEQTE